MSGLLYFKGGGKSLSFTNIGLYSVEIRSKIGNLPQILLHIQLYKHNPDTRLLKPVDELLNIYSRSFGMCNKAQLISSYLMVSQLEPAVHTKQWRRIQPNNTKLRVSLLSPAY